MTSIQIISKDNLGIGFEFDNLNSKINVSPSSDINNALKVGTDNLLYVSNKQDLHFSYTQGSASSTWVIVHSLGKFPSATIVDSAGTEVEGSINHIDVNNLVISFSSPFSGKAFLN